jgi:threonine dehydrogenase-like Zn-dependent dehydrogenase
MKAVVSDRGLTFAEDYPMPVPEPGEALVRVLLAGICRTDLEIVRGYKGFAGVLGHEFVGVVEPARGAASRVPARRPLDGRRVVGEINLACGRCDYCLRGMRNHCPRRRVLGILGKDGALAEYLTLPVENLHEVPDEVSDEEAVFTEPLAAAYRVPEQLSLQKTAGPGTKAAVLGDGKLGILAALALKERGLNPLLVGKHEEKLGIARAQGVRVSLLDAVRAERFFDVVVEATGSPRGLEVALFLIRPQGTVVLKSTVARPEALDLSPVVVDEVTVLGSRCGPFGPALTALARRLVNVRPLITDILPFGRIREAFQKAEGRDALTVLVDFR